MSQFLRVLTLNIWNYNEPWIRRRDLIVETIRQHNPDIPITLALLLIFAWDRE